ncbi:MAG: hypothetical protein B9J98_05320 [Candidatus Terraquivivens tikiterensis]|uniref:rRNA small subunit methyltransferase F RNA-binding PUA-like domain-containing protein n=1 Tax=Candidatus Terraquivivens tikiterensis TaxID=1980982 RepID=A0A2R7Y2H1_9ARCH|nr:MAG: hypothetical protein B9J98_05320 [Candidatus Terraquivivens tikiterensis]
MKKIILLSSSKRSAFQAMLERQYGAKDFSDKVLIQVGEGKVRLTTSDTIRVAERMRGVQTLGIYVAKVVGQDVVLSIEGSQLLCKSIEKNRIELTEEQARLWMEGAPIQLEGPILAKYVVASYGGLCLGCGRVSADGKVYPQVPKWRRLQQT